MAAAGVGTSGCANCRDRSRAARGVCETVEEGGFAGGGNGVGAGCAGGGGRVCAAAAE